MPYKNRKKRKKFAKKHYEANKEAYKGRAVRHNKKARERNRNYVLEYLRSHPCIDCEEGDIIVLEFDHVKGEKICEISTAANSGWSLERLKKEIEKCEVRCANCHRRATHKRRLRRSETDGEKKRRIILGS